MNWEQEVLKRRNEIVEDIQGFKINSVLDEETAGPGRPFGKGIQECLTALLNKGEESGFTVKTLTVMQAISNGERRGDYRRALPH